MPIGVEGICLMASRCAYTADRNACTGAADFPYQRSLSAVRSGAFGGAVQIFDRGRAAAPASRPSTVGAANFVVMAFRFPSRLTCASQHEIRRDRSIERFAALQPREGRTSTLAESSSCERPKHHPTTQDTRGVSKQRVPCVALRIDISAQPAKPGLLKAHTLTDFLHLGLSTPILKALQAEGSKRLPQYKPKPSRSFLPRAMYSASPRRAPARPLHSRRRSFNAWQLTAVAPSTGLPGSGAQPHHIGLARNGATFLVPRPRPDIPAAAQRERTARRARRG